MFIAVIKTSEPAFGIADTCNWKDGILDQTDPKFTMHHRRTKTRSVSTSGFLMSSMLRKN